MDVEKLKTCKIDYDTGLYRFMNNISLYEGLLKEFVKTNEYEYAKKAFERKDFSAMFRNLHAMEGITGNLGMNELYNLTCEVVEVLRCEEYSKIEPIYGKIQQEYKYVINGINLAMD